MDVYDRFRQEGDYYDVTGTQPPTAFAEVPATSQATVQYGGVPTTRRVLNVSRNDYNMPGSLEAYQSYGIPPVMVQSDPYARIAYSYGPSGPIPLIGATSVYPHVVSSGDYDYAAPYRRTIVPVGGSLDAIMAHIERMAQLMRRGGGGSGNGTAKKQDTQTPTDDLALPPEGATPRGNIEAPMLRPNIPQLDVPAPLTKKPDELVPVPVNPPGYYNPNIKMRTAAEIEAERQAQLQAQREIEAQRAARLRQGTLPPAVGPVVPIVPTVPQDLLTTPPTTLEERRRAQALQRAQGLAESMTIPQVPPAGRSTPPSILIMPPVQ